MIQKQRAALKMPLLIPALVLPLFCAFGFFSASASAQAKSKPRPGEMGYIYPVFSEKDFLLFLELVSFVNSGAEPAVFYRQNGVNEEYVQALAFKISMNTMGKLADTMDDVAARFGKSIVFSSSEDRLYQKYEAQILTNLAESAAGH